MNNVIDTVKDRAMNKLVPDFAKDLFHGSKEQLPESVKKDVEKVDEERSGLLGEVFESFLARKFPQTSRILDLLSATGIKEGDPEIYSLQNEFEALSALTTFIPDRFLRKLTDPLLETSWFKTIVDYYPLD